MTEWKTYRLGDITIMRNGKKRPNTQGTYPVYGGNGIMDYTDCYNAENTIIVGRVGAYCGNVYQCKNKCWVSDNAISVSASELVDDNYLYYLMSSLDFHHHHIGGAQPLITQDIIGGFEIFLPPLEEQRRIAGILGAIDDKIENNRRINTNLELQAQALFEEIFFSDNDWEYTTLGMLTEEVKTKVSGMDAKVLSPISSGELVLSEDYFTKQVYSQDTSKYIVVEPKTFAYNPARINIGSIGINSFDFIGCVSPVYVVFKTKSEYENYFRLFVKSDIFKEEVKSRAIGGVRQTLSYRDFAMITTKHPPIESIRTFNDQYNTLLDIINHNNTENRVLATLRDTLLPKLMNGEIKL